MSKRSLSFPDVCLGALALGGALIAAVHCGASEEAPPSAEEDGGTPGSSDDGGAAVVPDQDSGASVTKSDGGTVDSGFGDTPFTVCGGSKGDPGAVPLLDWAIINNPWKYKVILGASAPDKEYASYSSTLVLATGTVAEDTAQVSTFIGGSGKFESDGPLSKYAFVDNVMPQTDQAFDRVGWTQWNESLFELRTAYAVSGWKHFRVAGKAAHITARSWSLVNATKVADFDPIYVRKIEATHGFGWFFTVVFDHECKAAAFDALIGPNALYILEGFVPRAKVSKFLVENNARLFLTAATFGAEDPNIKAALLGTQASAATLDALEATMTAFTKAMKTYYQNVGTPTYESVSTGTNPSWVIGAVHSAPVAELP